MIQIRKGIYETNSSSSNVFAIPKDDIELHIPKSIDLDKWYPEDTIEYRICLLYSYLRNVEEQVLFEKYLEDKGVTIVSHNECLPTFPADYLFNNEKQLDKFLFGDGVIETYRREEGNPTKMRRQVLDIENYDIIRMDE